MVLHDFAIHPRAGRHADVPWAWIAGAAVLFAVLWSALSLVGPATGPGADLPVWHGNVSVSE